MTSAPLDSPISRAFEMVADGPNRSIMVREEFSNAPNALPPEKGFPFGGLLAALSAKAMAEGLGIEAPLQSLTVQYLAAAKFGQPLTFAPTLLRQGRQVSFARLDARQGDRLTHTANATFGFDGPSVDPLREKTRIPVSPHGLTLAEGMRGPFSPRFASHIEYRFERGPNIFGGNKNHPKREGAWMRFEDDQPLDVYRLCYLMDALYPPATTAFERPMVMTSVDLRYDIINHPDATNTPDGWAFLEFDLIEHDREWSVDDVTVWSESGIVLAVGRQRRRVLNRK
ncbi:thioesterase family protein [uncultured Brevundimonas sp.]|uniref:acyl-CoA thioesterase n=1 Tax=uncultured Brevundimonas sp. TaxID=213418 RepID=UPI00261531E2|nr:thioesterase family protein [uncultured Brevundimonas sp.]